MANRSGRPPPDFILNKPVLEESLELYFTAYNDLESCRMVGMSQGPIPWTAIKDYCVYHELDDEQCFLMFGLIKRMDNAYLLYVAEKIKKQTPP